MKNLQPGCCSKTAALLAGAGCLASKKAGVLQRLMHQRETGKGCGVFVTVIWSSHSDDSLSSPESDKADHRIASPAAELWKKSGTRLWNARTHERGDRSSGHRDNGHPVSMAGHSWLKNLRQLLGKESPHNGWWHWSKCDTPRVSGYRSVFYPYKLVLAHLERLNFFCKALLSETERCRSHKRERSSVPGVLKSESAVQICKPQ